MNPSRRASLRRILRTAVALPALYACGGGGGSNAQSTAPAASRQSVDVRSYGARGDGVNNDLVAIRTAARAAVAQPASDLWFPPGDYWLGDVGAGEALVAIRGASDLGLFGNAARLRCRTTDGIASILQFAGSHGVRIAGLAFQDDGLDRAVTWQGATAIYISGDGAGGCSAFDVTDCRFERVLAAVTAGGTRAEVRDLELRDLVVAGSYYGLNFQNNGHQVRASGLVFDDVRRSYFPYGVDDHDIAFTSRNNATGSVDVLIKCYSRPTTNIRVDGRVTGKRGGDAIVALEHEHASAEGVIAGVRIRLDVSDADCALRNMFLFQSYAPNGALESTTRSVWRDIELDGSYALCDSRTRFFAAPSAPVERALVRIGRGVDSRLLPASTPAGFDLGVG